MIGGGGGGGAGKDGGPTDSSLCRGGSSGGAGSMVWINVLPVKKGDRLKFVLGTGGAGATLSGGNGLNGGNSQFYLNDVLVATAGGGYGGKGGNRTGTTVLGGAGGTPTIHVQLPGAKLMSSTAYSGVRATAWNGPGPSYGSTLGIYNNTAAYRSVVVESNWWGFGGGGGSTYTGTGSSKFSKGLNGKVGAGRIIWGEGREFLNTLVYDM